MNGPWNHDSVREHISKRSTEEDHRDIRAPRRVVAAPRVSSINPEQVQIIGIPLVRPDNSIAEKEIHRGLGYYHHRSGRAIDFFCGGYGLDLTMFPDAEKVPIIIPDGQQWSYSAKAFAAFVTQLESESNWKYHGGPELLLLIARFDAGKRGVRMDYSSAIVIELQRAIDDKAIVSVQWLFETIISQADDNSLATMSDINGVMSFLSKIGDHLLEKVPFGIGIGIKSASYFAVRNFSK